MKRIRTIALKEVWGYLTSPVGYVFAGLLLIVANWLFFQDFFLLNQADLTTLWNSLGFLLSIFIPALSMNLISEEKRNGNWEVILSLPVTEFELVIGKFIGAFLYIFVTLLLLSPTVITVLLLGKPDLGILIGGWLGVLGLAVVYLAVGIFCSSLSNQPAVGFLMATILLLVNNFIGQAGVLQRLPVFLGTIFEFLSITWHANQFGLGVVRLEDITFLVSTTGIFLLLTVLYLKARNK